MDFTCTRQELLEAVNAVSRAVSSKVTLPILSGIYLETTDGILRLVATDMEMGIEYTLPVSVALQGATVVNARVFNEMVRRLPDGPVNFVVAAETAVLKVRYQRSEVTLNTMNPAEFPLLPTILDGDRFCLTQAQFKEMTRLVCFAAAIDESRPWFAGVFCDISPTGVNWVATDTHRLALLTTELPPESTVSERQVILSAKILADVARLLPGEDLPVQITFTQSQALLETGYLRVILRIIQGQYPKYQQVIPREHKGRLTIATKNLSEAVDRAALAALGKEGSNIIKLNVENDSLTIRANSPEVGQIYEEVIANIEGETVPIAFNYRYLQDALKVIGTEEIHLDLSATLLPGVLRGVGEERYLYLIVPIRTG
ncbi:MAG: DNA polymerase III subunit beta [Heliobacteriaceae bacterium]|nr:DNA polymerase III subunit beta [Heliobacteriaceae bacterium]